MLNGAPWHDLPGRYPPYQTCHRRFRRWNEKGVLEGVLRAVTEDLKGRGGLDLSECSIDGTFAGAKKGGGGWGRPSGARARSSWRWQTALVFLSVRTAGASPHEVTLVGAALRATFLSERPERPIGDRAYDSDPLDEAPAEEGIETIAPHRKNRSKPKTRDGRKLRRYKRRRKIERLFAWLSNLRGLVVRYERRAENYLGFARLGCIVILLRHL